MEPRHVLTILSRIILFPVAVIFAIFVSIFVIISLLLNCIPFKLYKLFVALVLKCLSPGSKIMSIQDGVMAMIDFQKDRHMYVHSQWNFEGRINFEDLVEIWEERVMKKQLPSGEIKFPELKYYIGTFMGYFIRRRDEFFNLQNHLQLHVEPSDSIIDRKRLCKIIADFATTFFPVKRSLWQILLVNNYKMDEESDQEYSVVVFKYHHCLADGYASVILMWEALLLQELQTFAKPKMIGGIKKTKWQRFLTSVAIVLQGIKMGMYLPFNHILNPKKLFDVNSWHSSDQTSEYAHCAMTPIETSLVKEVSANNKITITTALLAGITGGFRRMMEAKGFKTPKSIRMTYSLPLSNHPDALTNHSIVTYFNHKMHNQESDFTAKNVMQYNEREMKLAIRPALAMTKPLMFLAGSTPLTWSRYISSDTQPFSFTTFCGTVPLPQPLNNDVEFLGTKLVGSYAAAELSTATHACTTVFVMKYKQHFFINYGIQKHLLKDEDDIYNIEKYVREELIHLRNLSSEESHDQLMANSYDNVITISDLVIGERENDDV